MADGLIERLQGSGTYVLGAGALGLPSGREGSALVHRLVERSAGPLSERQGLSSIVDLSISVLHDASDLPPVSLSSSELGAVHPDTGYSPWGLTGLRAAVVYLQSTVHSPTGAVLSESRRRQVAALMREARAPLLEDLALADLAWAPAPSPIASWCTGASAAVVGSLSKLFWGGLRIGWVRAPAPLAIRFARVTATQDLGSSAVSQVLAERLLRSLATAPGSTYVDRLQAKLRSRYETLTLALTARLPSWTWARPSGGLSIWVQLPTPTAEAFAQSALRHGVAVATAPRPRSRPPSRTACTSVTASRASRRQAAVRQHRGASSRASWCRIPRSRSTTVTLTWPFLDQGGTVNVVPMYKRLGFRG